MRSLSQFTVEELVEMGVTSLWIGVESSLTDLPKRQGRNMKELFSELHSSGIQTIGSFIVGLDFHSPENVWQDIDYFVSMSPTYSQVSSLMPCPETRLWKRMLEEKRLYTENFKWRQHHLYSLMHKHTLINDEDIPGLVQETMRRLFRANGPSVLRTFRVNFDGYLYSREHDNPRIRQRAPLFEKWCRRIAPALPALKIYAPSREVRKKISGIQKRYTGTFGKLTFRQRIEASVFIILATAGKIMKPFQDFRFGPFTRRFLYNYNEK